MRRAIVRLPRPRLQAVTAALDSALLIGSPRDLCEYGFETPQLRPSRSFPRPTFCDSQRTAHASISRPWD